MLGSSQSIAGPNIALNTIMAEELAQFADILEQAEDFDTALQKLVYETFTNHQRIIFNGNGYSEEWQQEAERRGLSNLRSTAKALPTYIDPKNIELVTRHGIYTEAEFRARYEIHLENYCKLMRIESKTMVDMVLHQLLPAGLQYSSDLAEGICRKQQALGKHANVIAEVSLTKRLSDCCSSIYEKCEALNTAIKAVPSDSQIAADYYSDVVVPAMESLRKDADLLERLTAKNYWPYPTYSDILYY